jgi:hypothetical protein
MQLSAGDRVKFLNTTGGGVVVRVIDSRTVSVMTEEGFELPTLISELIRLEPNEPGARFFDEHFNVSMNLPDEEFSHEKPEDDRMKSLPAGIIRNRKKEEIFLSFVPHDQKWLITGMVDILLINNTEYDILYSIFLKNNLGHFEGKDYGSIFPDSFLLLDTVNHEQMTHWTQGYIQLLFHRERSNAVIPPFHAEFTIDGKKFLKEGSFRESPFTGDKALTIRIIALTDLLNKKHVSDQPVTDSNRKEQGSHLPLILNYQIAPREAEVDLHIHELMEDPSNLENQEVLDYQVQFFRKCLDSAMANYFLKITFIHGVGNGTLRQHLVSILEKEEGIEFFDAPMSRYGSGALEIRIHHNR